MRGRVFRGLTVLVAIMMLLTTGCLSPGPSNLSRENRPPATPSVRTPSNGGEDVSVTPTLSWTCSDPDGDSLTYEVFFGTDRERLEKLGSTSSTSYRITEPLKVGTTYYWKVVARDSRGATTNGDVWCFRTARLSVIFSQQYHNLSFLDTPSSPVVGWDGRIYIGSNEGLAKFSQECKLEALIEREMGSGCPISAPPTVDSQTGRIYFVDNGGHIVIYEGELPPRFYRELENFFIVSPVVFGGFVYAINVSGKVYKMSKGDLVGNEVLDLNAKYVRTSPVVVGGKLIVVCEAWEESRNVVYGIDTSTLEIVWSEEVPMNPTSKGVAVDRDGNLYLVGREKLLCIGSNGKKKWEFPIDGLGSFYGGPVVSSDGIIYVSTDEGTVYAIDSSGREMWRRDVGGPIHTSCIVGDINVLYVIAGNILMALNAKTGEEIDKVELGSYVYSNPVLYEGKIFLGDEKGTLYAIKALNDDLDDPSQAWPMFQKDQYHTGVR